MTGKIARSLAAALLLAGLAVPAAARPAPETSPSFLLQAWEWLSAPFVALFDTTDTEGRSMWDPNGLTSEDPDTENDGRGMWDPNG